MSIRAPGTSDVIDGKYRLLRRIGVGGMGDVYRAHHVATGEAVAVKILHPELADDRDLAQRLFLEAQAASRIRHPNVVAVLDYGIADVGPYLVMEHLDGESVGRALVRLGRFEVDAAVGMAIPLLDALGAAHREGIIHRDLKPENVFIARDADGATGVRLLDFGVAKVLDAAETPRTRTGIVFGTPDYLSPEQATGDGPLDGRSDLFAVGVILFEVLTGQRPFAAPTAVATAFRVVHAEAPALASLGAAVDAGTEAVIQRLLRKDPGSRYASAEEVIADLERIVPDRDRRAQALGRILDPV